MKTIAIAAAALAFAAVATAKLPAPVLDDAAKAKAAEAAARTAWQAKIDAWQLCKAQDAVVAKYRKAQGGSAGKDVPAAAVKTAAATAPAKPQAGASAPATTPATAAAPTPCSDPGAFAYNPPEQKPLETSGAHSPAGNATSPPSVRAESATMVPGKTGAQAPAPAAAASAKKS